LSVTKLVGSASKLVLLMRDDGPMTFDRTEIGGIIIGVATVALIVWIVWFQ
jgi:hypothetical protein